MELQKLVEVREQLARWVLTARGVAAGFSWWRSLGVVRGRGESAVGSAGSATVSARCQAARSRPSCGFPLPDNTNFGELSSGCARDQAAGWLWHLALDSASEVPGYASGVGRDTGSVENRAGENRVRLS